AAAPFQSVQLAEMVDSPEHRHRTWRSRGALPLARAPRFKQPASRGLTQNFLLFSAPRGFRIAQRSNSRPERYLSLQRAHGSASPDHDAVPSAHHFRRAWLDAASGAEKSDCPRDCKISDEANDMLRHFQ